MNNLYLIEVFYQRDRNKQIYELTDLVTRPTFHFVSAKSKREAWQKLIEDPDSYGVKNVKFLKQNLKDPQKVLIMNYLLLDCELLRYINIISNQNYTDYQPFHETTEDERRECKKKIESQKITHYNLFHT